MKRSLTAQRVAREVLETLGKGKRPNITKIAIKNGYTYNTANAGIVQTTKSYQDVIKPFILKLEEERERAIDAMKGKIDEATYRDLSDAIDKLTKNHQLLTGGSTANVALGVKKLKDDELERIAEGSQD